MKQWIVLLIGLFLASLFDFVFSNTLGKTFDVNKALIYAVGIIISSIFLILLEQKRNLKVNWWWHRFWIEIELRKKYESELKLKSKKDTFDKFINFPQKSNIDFFVGNKRIDVIDYVQDRISAKPSKPLVVSGDAGSGKSFAIVQLAFYLLKRAFWTGGFFYPIPIVIYAERYSGSLIEAIASTLSYFTPGKDGTVLNDGLDELLRRGKFLIIIDGIEQTPEENYQRVVNDVVQLVNSPAYNRNQYIFTCRSGYVNHYFDSTKISYELFEVQDLTDEAVDALINLYKPEHIEKKKEEIDTDLLFPKLIEEDKTDTQYILRKLREQDLLAPKALARNVYWLSIMASEGIYDKNPAVILDSAINQLLKRERERPGKKTNWRKIEPAEAQIFQTRRLLTLLALEFVSKGVYALGYDETIVIIRNTIKTEEYREISSDDVIGLGQDAQIIEATHYVLAGRKDSIKFRHSLLLNFLAACELFANDSLIKEHSKNIVERSTNWWMTLILYAKLIDALDDSQKWNKKGVVEKEFENISSLKSALVKFCAFDSLSHAVYSDKVLNVIHVELSQSELADEKMQLIGQVASLLPQEFSNMIGNIRVHSGIEENVRKFIFYLVEKELSSGHGTSLLYHLLEFFSFGELDDSTKNQTIGSFVVNALVAQKNNALQPLFELLRLPGFHHQILILSALGRIKNHDATPEILEFIGYGLKSFDILEPTLKISKFNQIIAAINALGDIGDARAVQVLVKLLGLENDFISIAIKQALSKMGEAGVIELFSVARNEDAVNASYFSQIPYFIMSAGSVSIPHIKKSLKSLSSSEKIVAIKSIQMMKETSLLEDVAVNLSDVDSRVRIQAIQCLGQFGKKGFDLLRGGIYKKVTIGGITPLWNWNQNKLFTNRLISMSLANSKSKLSDLHEMLDDPNIWVKICALDAIGLVHENKSCAKLGEVLNSTTNVCLFHSAVSALLKQPVEISQDLLIKHLKDENDDFGRFLEDSRKKDFLLQTGVISINNIYLLFNMLVAQSATGNDNAKIWLKDVAEHGFGYKNKDADKFFRMQAGIEIAMISYMSLIKDQTEFLTKLTSQYSMMAKRKRK